MTAPLLDLRGISKAFPGVQALADVNLTLYPGEIHALLGENGAGKSTLMKILNGVYQADSGSIRWEGQPIRIANPQAAQAQGIAMIHQELALIPYLDAAKNIYLGREPQGRIPGTVAWRALYRQAAQDLKRLNLFIDPRRPVRFLPIAQQQMIEVAKALSRNARCIIMDEPTSSLTEHETATLFEQMRALKAQGVAVVFISHRLEEVFAICDRVTVLRDGQFVATEPIHNLTTEDIIRLMVGREMGQLYEPRPASIRPETVLAVEHLARGDVLHDINFSLRRGEIVGIAGLVGAGRTELAETLFGIHPASSGQVRLEGRAIRIRNPRQAIRAGIALVTEDRKGLGLFLKLNVGTNIVMAGLRQLLRGGLFVQWGRVRQLGEGYVQQLSIRTPSLQQTVRNLSGGNQQKVVISKWLLMRPKVLILDEPTRGIDVGAKHEIYKLMNELTAQGMAILVISSELPEVMGVSDRILVMHEGRITGEFSAASASQDALMRAASGLSATPV